MATTYLKKGLTGGTSIDLNGINGSTIAVDDVAFVTYNDQFYVYRLKESGAASNPPNVIAPSTNAGSKRWHRQGEGSQGVPGQGVPSGGAEGQILAKSSPNDYDAEWRDVPPIHSHVNKLNLDKIGEANNLPTWDGGTWPGGGGTGDGNVPAGGTTGQMLAKRSGSNYDTEWVNPPVGGTGGGDMYKTTYDPAGGSKQVAFNDQLHSHTNKSTIDKITESSNLPLWNGGSWPGIVGGAEIVEKLHQDQPGTSWTITGPKVAASDPPSPGTTTQAMINWFIARGVPSTNLLWNVVGEEGEGGDVTPPVVTAFTMPSSSTSLSVAVSTFTATDNIGVTGYRLTETSTEPAAGSGFGAKPTSYTFSSVGNKVVYPWARDLAGNVSNVFASPASIAVTAAPNAVTSLTATAGNAEIALNWTKSSGDSTHSPATNYDVKWGTTNPPTTTISNVGDVGYYLKTGLVNGTTYYFQVVAKNTAGTATSSTVNSAPTDVSNQAPTQPSSLSAGTYLTNGAGFTLSWDAATDPDGYVASYKVYKNSVLAYSGVATISKDITGQASGSSANWTVSAVDNQGLEGQQSTALAVSTLCAAPTGSSATFVSFSAISLNPGTSSGATSYNVYYTNNGSEPTTSSTKISGVTNGYSHSGLTYGLTYKYKFVAVNATGESLLSATSTVALVLAAPTGHSVTAGDTKITVVSPGTSAGATGYKYYLTDDGSTPSKSNFAYSGVATTDLDIIGLTNDVLYKICFTATEGANESTESTVLSVTPEAAASDPWPIDEEFGSNDYGIFSVTSGTVLIRLNDSDWEASLGYGTMVAPVASQGRGIFAEFTMRCPTQVVGATAFVGLNNGESGIAGYGLLFIYDDYEEVWYVGLSKNGTSRIGGLTMASPLSNTVYRIEIPAFGDIIFKKDGTQIASVTDATYNTFNHIYCTGAGSGSVRMTRVQAGAL